MDNLFLMINKFAMINLVSLKVDFAWFDIKIEMIRDNYKVCTRITNKELEMINFDVVIKTTLEDMLKEINKNYKGEEYE